MNLSELTDREKLTQLLSNAALGGEHPHAVVITEDMVPKAIRDDFEQFKQLFFSSKEFGRYPVDRLDLEPALIWYTAQNERIERRFSDLFIGKLANCPRCGGKLFRFGYSWWRCRECEWNNVPSLGFVPMPSLHSPSVR